MRPLRVTLFSMLLLALPACTKTDSTSPSAPTSHTLALADLVGDWLVEAGGMMPDFLVAPLTTGVTADVTAIRIGDDGTGRVWLRDRLTGAKDRVRAFVLYDENDVSLIFDFAAETSAGFAFNGAVNRTTFSYPVVTLDGATLRIADGEGRVAILSHQSSLPDSVTLRALGIVDRHDDLPAPVYFSDLAHFDGDLMYAGLTNLERFALSNHALGTPYGPTSSRLVQTAQGAYFWSHCGCGGSRDAFEQDLSGVVDTVSSEDEMGGPITFRAMAYAPNTDRLWLHGRPFDAQIGQFYVMNTNGEPDQVERTLPFNRDLRALAFDGADLWGVETLATQMIVRIDPATGQVLESYEPPDRQVAWSGLEYAPDGMYLLGTDAQGKGVIIRAARP